MGYIPYNPAKVNQDRAVELLRFNQSERQALFAVFDGHGALGHEVSTYLTQELPRQLSRTATASAGSELTAQVTKAFTDTNALLAQTSRIDCTFSGSTGIVCWMREHKLYTCNVGDSRAVLCRRQPIVPPASASTSSSSLPAASFSAFSYTAVGLSVDQKPDRPDERRRILAQHGRVEACKGSRGEDIGPARVWIQGQDVPGLAMSRSFGDLIAASVGVTARPEVDERELDDSDVFIVLGSRRRLGVPQQRRGGRAGGGRGRRGGRESGGRGSRCGGRGHAQVEQRGGGGGRHHLRHCLLLMTPCPYSSSETRAPVFTETRAEPVSALLSPPAQHYHTVGDSPNLHCIWASLDMK